MFFIILHTNVHQFELLPGDMHSSSDLQLAMYLQQQEFEQQNQSRSTPSASTLARPQPQTAPGRADGSRLITVRDHIPYGITVLEALDFSDFSTMMSLFDC